MRIIKRITLAVPHCDDNLEMAAAIVDAFEEQGTIVGDIYEEPATRLGNGAGYPRFTGTVDIARAEDQAEWPIVPVVGDVPVYAHADDAGADMRAAEGVVVPSGGIVPVPLGVRVELPSDVVGLLFPRSGLGRAGIGFPNGVGVIDPGYRGPATGARSRRRSSTTARTGMS